jgi:hypothetical protein
MEKCEVRSGKCDKGETTRCDEPCKLDPPCDECAANNDLQAE